MTRREAIVRLAVMMGATVVGPKLLAADFGREGGSEKALQSAAAAPDPVFSAEEIALLDEIGETIIPTTDVPGARAVGIGAFIAMMITDCYYPKEQAAFRAGLRELPDAFEAKYQEKFLGGSAANRTAFLNDLDREQQAVAAKQKERKKFVHENASTEESSEPDDEVPHYFRMMKELTILGYFTSEIGSTQVLGWVEVPGRYDGNVPYKKGDKPGTDMRF
jgi:hypothetical protein